MFVCVCCFRGVSEIEATLRSTFKEVIPCDLELDNPLISPGHR